MVGRAGVVSNGRQRGARAILVTGPFGVGGGLGFEDPVVDNRGAMADVVIPARRG